jgi:hypothetical protein
VGVDDVTAPRSEPLKSLGQDQIADRDRLDVEKPVEQVRLEIRGSVQAIDPDA